MSCFGEKDDISLCFISSVPKKRKARIYGIRQKYFWQKRTDRGEYPVDKDGKRSGEHARDRRME